MRISDLLKLSTDNLKRRKGRTILTVLGVVIGTCSIVMMLSIGIAINKSNEEMVKNMSDLTKIEIYNYKPEKEQAPITDKVIDEFKNIEHVKMATPLYESDFMHYIQIKSGKNGKYLWNGSFGFSVVGVYPEALPDYGYELLEGKFIEKTDKPYTILVGERFAYQFTDSKKSYPHNMVSYMPDENGVVKKPFVDVKKDKMILEVEGNDADTKSIEKQLKVAGIIKGNYGKGYETYDGIVMSIYDILELEKEYIKVNKIKVDKKQRVKSYKRAVVKVKDVKNVDSVINTIKDMGYETSSATEMLESMKKSTRSIQFILAGLGSIAMLVASISIANTMTMAIYERRREIGIMKVLGCEIKNIRAMFLLESAGIGFLGGIIGVSICYILSYTLNYVANTFMGSYAMGMDGETVKTYISIIPIWLALVGLGFSTLVGTISGYFPANKAVKISALTAIKND